MLALARTCPTCGVITFGATETPTPTGGRTTDRARCGNCTTILDLVPVERVVIQTVPGEWHGETELSGA